MSKFLKFYLRISFWLLFLLLSFQGKAQSDVRLQAGVKLKSEVFKDADLSLNIEQRFNNNVSTFDKFIVEPGFAYSLNKRIRTGVEYRYYINQNWNHTRESRHRFSGFFRYKKDVDDFTIRAKTILQYGIDDEAGFAFDYRNKLINRNSVSLAYNIFGSKFTPKAEYELFFYLNNPERAIINGWRISTAVDYDLSKKTTLSLQYMYDKELNVVYPINAHIFGVELEINLF